MQSEVANIIGVSEESIWNWEKGRTKPSKKNLEIINEFVATRITPISLGSIDKSLHCYHSS